MITSGALHVWEAETDDDRWLSVDARHRIFCLGGGGEVLERCEAAYPGAPHDEYDSAALLFGGNVGDEVMATARLILGTDLHKLPTGRLLDRLEIPPVLSPAVRYSEPSRLGMLQPFQGSREGRFVLLQLIGLLANTSIEMGYDHYLLSLRGVLTRAISWFPWTLAPPIDYPASEGGPITAEPIWPATLSLHELAVITKHDRPAAYAVMFPTEPTWVDHSQVRSIRKLRELVRSNREKIAHSVQAWKRGAPLAALSASQDA